MGNARSGARPEREIDDTGDFCYKRPKNGSARNEAPARGTQHAGSLSEPRPIAFALSSGAAVPMNEITTKPRTKVKTKTQRPRLHKVILVNDDYTPREFVVTVLKGEFRMSEDQAYRVMMTAHRRGVCVVAVYTKDVAETKATRGTEAGRSKGYPLLFTTEPEE
jgi:ATP-dependent Clp protease adaptor protein ClpS